MSTQKDPTDPDEEMRHGSYRDLALAHYGEECLECGWSPDHEFRLYRLHVHHEKPQSLGGSDQLDNLKVLCVECHRSKHSTAPYEMGETIGRLTRTLSQAITHKTNGFADRVARRVRMNSIDIVDGELPPAAENASEHESNEDWFGLVEGLLDGDHYDEYFVDIGNEYLQMCSCYLHHGGGNRAIHICTHVGAAIVRKALEIAHNGGEEAALNYVQSIGKKLDSAAEEFIEKQELVKDTIGTLDVADTFSETWANRARRQAKKLTKFGKEWKAFGGECEGCEITLTAEGFRCTAACDKDWAAEDKWPCPGKLAAYILTESGDGRVVPDFEDGQPLEVKQGFDSLGSIVVATDVDDDTQTVTFVSIPEFKESTLSYDDVTTGILNNSISAIDWEDAIPWNIRVERDESGSPVSLAPDVDGHVMKVSETRTVSPSEDNDPLDLHQDNTEDQEYQAKLHAEEQIYDVFEPGEMVYVVETDDDNRTVTFSRLEYGERAKLDYDTVVHGIKTKDLFTDSVGLEDEWGIEVLEDENGVPKLFAPDLEDGLVMQVESEFSECLSVGDYVCIVGRDDEEQEIALDVLPEGERVMLEYRTVTDAIRNYDIMKRSPSDTGFIILSYTVDGGSGVAIKSPYSAKDDIKSLDYDKTERHWNGNAWVVDSESIDEVVDHLENRGWDVYVSPVVEREIGDSAHSD